ncbi:histone-lysine N-methyltransferase EZH2 [Podospora conica]|nr:histone-lysine N-methyltransferase EZH2 [Schizothecium conicum]
MAPVVVDLTEDDVVVNNNAAVPAAFQHLPSRTGNGNVTSLWLQRRPSQPLPANPLGFSNTSRNPKPPPPNTRDAPGSPSATTSRPSVKNEGPSPSGGPRFTVHILDPSPVAKDPQPLHLKLPTLGKPPPSRYAATAPPPPPIQRPMTGVQGPTTGLQDPTTGVQGPTTAVQQPPELQTPKKENWTVEKIAAKLGGFVENVGKDHARLVEFLLEEAETRAPQARHLSEFDDFADMKSIAADQGADSGSDPDLINFRFKLHSGEHSKSKNSGKKGVFRVVRIKTDKAAVPGYRFHHVEIRKNILAPNTMLNFVPHLRDVDPNSAEERKYSNWLTELEKLDSQSGFKTQDRIQKFARREREEYAARISMYLEPWLKKLGLEGCTKSSLIRFMITQTEESDAITPKQKSTILNTVDEEASPEASVGARLFTEAFNRVFNNPAKVPRVSLRDVLMLDKSVETTLETKTIIDTKQGKDTPGSQRQRHDVAPPQTSEELLPQIETALASYSILGCMICFSHDCEHGEYDTQNQRRTFSLDTTGGLVRALEGKWRSQIKENESYQNGSASKPVLHSPCRNSCYRSYDVGNTAHPVRPWTESETHILTRIFATIGHSTTLKPYCFVASVLDRMCWDVYRKFKELNISLPETEPCPEPAKVKPVPWYDRKKKQLMGDWSDYTVTHDHPNREITEPCHHDGPCTAKNDCPCAKAHPRVVMCERFCNCTAEECAIKFTGCACHSLGRTCLQKQKEGKPCICVQLNRECDPVLCKGCGAQERADPERAHDEQLHSTGCQNVPLQRGLSKAVIVGKSQLEACGYGLFTAEDIAQEEFVIEYTGELITHDEGVRREARRGDVFDESSTASYLFTLLDQEGIWVDAAIYGNLSRYINHASETDRKGCNITPKIMYVNHEFRIKFSALRDIKAGEELFFDYGENFPNLTKRLLEGEDGEPSKDAAKARKAVARGRETARKMTNKTNGRAKKGGRSADNGLDSDADGSPKKKKRGGRRPGAGRKKKPILQDNAQPARSLDSEISDSQADSPLSGAVGNRPGSPSWRRRAKRTVGSDESEKGPRAGKTTVKKVAGKRGGARPGAGRKPKHPRKVRREREVSRAAEDSRTTDEADTGKSGPSSDSDDEPLMRSGLLSGRGRGAATTTTATATTTTTEPAATGAGGGGRKRKADEAESGDEDARAGKRPARGPGPGPGPDAGEVSTAVGGAVVQQFPYQQHQFRPLDDDDNGDVDDDDDDDDMPIDARFRKRQKPARYRGGGTATSR